jgi:drug/metabolite transporter (DMT)-like permease
VGFAGAILVALPAAGEGENSAFGVFLILCALASYGVALNVAGPIQRQFGVVPLIWRAQGLAIIFTAPLGVPELMEAEWSLRPMVSLLLLGAFGTGIAYVMLAIAAGRLGATKASATTYLIPPVALVLGVLIRDEKVAILSIVGGAICVLGARLMNAARATTAPPVTESGNVAS